jgi:mRNA interferase RelE/StbE
MYNIDFTRKAQKNLDKLSDSIANPILDAIENLAENPKPYGHKKLKGRSGYRIRVGDYRIIYEIFDSILLIEVINLGHRKDIYE